MRFPLWFCLLLVVPACAGSDLAEDPGDAGPGGKADDPTEGDAGLPELPSDTTALLEIHALDIWGQALPASGTTLAVTRSGATVTTGSTTTWVPLSGSASYQITLVAAHHQPLALNVSYDGAGQLDGLTHDSNDAGQGVAIHREMRAVHENLAPVPVYGLYLGVRHAWFSAAGRPARHGNDARLLMDGEEAWSSVYEDLTFASKSVALSTWWWESDFELVRPGTHHITLSEEEREENTILGVLESSPATKRVIVNQIWGQDGVIDWTTSDAAVRAHGTAVNDNFEFMGQANPTSGTFYFEIASFSFGDRVRAAMDLDTAGFDSETPIESTVPGHDVDLNAWPVSVEVQHASFHQKFAVIDDEVAYIGGMNFRAVDWDSSAHEVFDYRRMNYGASEAERWAVSDKEELPDTGPRKDYMVRLAGPAVQDAADVFKKRWDGLRDDGVAYSAQTSEFEVDRDLVERGDIQVQVTATLPDPLWEHSIAETWFNAVANAEEYIYIEDQYFRAPMLNQAIIARMNEVPSLRLIVITKPINEWVDPGCAWTYAGNAEFEALFPDRYMLLQLRAFDTQVSWGWDETEGHFADFDVHSKMLVVDDLFMSVGSANKNNRGMIYEGEMNTAVFDADWVRAARRRVLANMLPASATPTDEVEVWWQQLRSAADWNEYVHGNWDSEGFDISLDGGWLPSEYTPEGFVYPLDFRAVENCLIEDIGPDMV